MGTDRSHGVILPGQHSEFLTLSGQAAGEQSRNPVYQAAATGGAGTVHGHCRDDFVGAVSPLNSCASYSIFTLPNVPY